MNPQLFTRSQKMKWLAVALVAIIIILLGFIGNQVFVLFSAKNHQTKQSLELNKNIPAITPKTTSTTQSIATSTTQSIITWKPRALDEPPIKSKTVKIPTPQHVPDILETYAIGTFTSGEFKDKTLSLVFDYEYMTPASFGSSDEYGMRSYGSNYAYFVSDSAGNPVAWDDRYYPLSDMGWCLYALDVDKCAGDAFKVTQILGLTEDLKKPLDFLSTFAGSPSLSVYSAVFSTKINSKGAKFSVINNTLRDPRTVGVYEPIGFTDEGYQIVKLTSGPSFGLYQPLGQDKLGFYEAGYYLTEPSSGKMVERVSLLPFVNYFIIFPFGASLQITPLPDFVPDLYKNGLPDGLPLLSWSNGDAAVFQYRSDVMGGPGFNNILQMYSYDNWGNSCLGSLNFNNVSWESALIQTGTTKNGDPVYEINPVGHDDVYQCFYKPAGWTYNSETKSWSQIRPAYADFIKSHPVFFWKHPTGDWIPFIRKDLISPP